MPKTVSIDRMEYHEKVHLLAEYFSSKYPREDSGNLKNIQKLNRISKKVYEENRRFGFEVAVIRANRSVIETVFKH